MEQYITQFLAHMKNIAQLMDRAPAFIEAYYKRGYHAGGSDEITDNDLVTAGITAEKLGAGITMLEQLGHLRAGQAAAQMDYGATLATLRRDL